MPNGMIKLLYTGSEEKVFTKNPDINYFKSVFKSYSNFVRIPEKVELINKYNINNSNVFDVDITNFSYDLLGDIYLHIELRNPITNSIFDFIEKIDFYCSDILIDSLTPDLIKLYKNIYYSSGKNKIYNLLTANGAKNIYYIPLHFHFLHKHSNFFPLYLLNNEKLRIKISFINISSTDVLADEINLVLNYFILDENEKRAFNKKLLVIENISYIENIKLDVSVSGDIPNKINFAFNNYCKALLFIVKNCNFDKMNFNVDGTKINYDTQYLKYATFLQTQLKNNSTLNNNENSKNDQILILPFSQFKSYVSGYINLNTINKLSLEFFPYIVSTAIDFNLTTVFDINYFFVTTNLVMSSKNQSPTITIYTNIIYLLTNSNCDIVITTVDPTTYITQKTEIPTSIYFPGFNYEKKTLMIDSTETYDTLYYCDKSNNISITSGRFIILDGNRAKAGVGNINVYSLNYMLYSIIDGKMYNMDL